MRGDIIYEVVAVGTDKDGTHKESYFGTYRLRTEAETQQAKLLAKTDWAGTGKSYKAYWDDFVIREVTVDTDFEIPSLPMPRDRYRYETEKVDNGKGYWNYLNKVFCGDDLVAEYQRNYGTMYRTFEPFRQNGHDYALISDSYVRTSVLDLESGTIIASEPKESGGFCPVGFYVPDWHDIHDNSEIPGNKYWDRDDEQPSGLYGFVWGCVWGDDNGWKVEYLDLSDIVNGNITRDARFGYLEIDDHDDKAKNFISIYNDTVTFSSPKSFNLNTGKISYPIDKERFLAAVTLEFGDGRGDLSEVLPVAEWIYKEYLEEPNGFTKSIWRT